MKETLGKRTMVFSERKNQLLDGGFNYFLFSALSKGVNMIMMVKHPSNSAFFGVGGIGFVLSYASIPLEKLRFS